MPDGVERAQAVSRPMALEPRLASRDGPAARSRVRLFLLSFLMLFVELVLIRWTVAFVLYLSFFTNFVLLASFLGIGVGFLRGGKGRDLFPYAPLALFALSVFVALTPVEAGSSRHEFVGLFGTDAMPQWVVLPGIFVGSFATMAAIANGVSRTFAMFAPLEAYRLDILGSIAGIAAFSLLSFLGAPPLVWAVVASALFLVLGGGEHRRQQVMGVLGFLLILGVESLPQVGRWSPYYRVTAGGPRADGVISIHVNGRRHQSIRPLENIRAEFPFYFDPYRHAPGNPLRDVLIVGAGNGNDVAVALAEGAKHVDAVEIDPLLYRIGRDRHPARPYQDHRVSVHIDDGRAFLHDTDRRYDLILFALPDSLILVHGQGSLRLESYLFTEEAMREVRAHLKPRGVFSMYNYYRLEVFDRYARTLQLVYGHPPCQDVVERLDPRQQAVLTISSNPSAVRCRTPWRPHGPVLAPATDDHPFPYLRSRTVPGAYVVTLLLILGFAVVAVRTVSGAIGRMRSYVDLFFMGAAFLLLETKNVVQFALLFGTTWFVNALVFAGILLAVLLAVEVARRARFRRPRLLYAALLAALVAAWAVPPEALLGLSFVPRFLAAVSVAFAPVFLANLVFAERFRGVGSSTVAFGANLLGAMVGGVLEYGALIVGYRALLLVVALLYGTAFLTGRGHLGGGGLRSTEPSIRPVSRSSA